jgi:multisubunit Na+/H+ antiporter MnhG subunit
MTAAVIVAAVVLLFLAGVTAIALARGAHRSIPWWETTIPDADEEL